MRTVWKYELPGVDVVLTMPAGAKVRHVAEQRGRLCLWAEVDDDSDVRDRRFLVVGTGHPIPAGAFMFVGSLLVDGGLYVFHVYEVMG